MFETKLTVKNETGLHARPASDLVKLSQEYESDITIYARAEKEEINPKSIVSVLAGGVMKGDDIIVQVEGPDEEEAGKALADFISNLTD